jgi:large subunit ribosomal protein L21
VYAIVEDSGTQIKLIPGTILDVDLRQEETAEGSTITFDRVLALKSDGDDSAKFGAPYLDGASVTAEVLAEIKGEKIDVIKYKRRKGYRRKVGHRQRLLRIRVGVISAKKKAPAKKKAAKKVETTSDE